MTTSFTISTSVTITRDIVLPGDFEGCRAMIGDRAVFDFVQRGIVEQVRSELRHYVRDIMNEGKNRLPVTGEDLMRSTFGGQNS